MKMTHRAAIILSAAVYAYVVIARENNVDLMSMPNNVDLMSMSKDYKLTIEDSGHVENCGTVPINLTWTPKDVSQFGEVTICINYTLPHEFNSGHFSLTSSLINLTDMFDCNLVTKYGFPCPLPEGITFDACHKFTNLQYLSYVELGTYAGRLQVWNIDGEEMVCVQANVTIEER